MAEQRNTEIRIAGNRVTEYFRDSGSLAQRLSVVAAAGSANLVYGRTNGMHYLCYRGSEVVDGHGLEHERHASQSAA